MKEKEAFVDDKKHVMTVFVEKDDGSYQAIETGSYMVKNYFDDFQKKMKYFQETAFNKLKNNEISPVGYYMILRDMAAGDVAVRVGISTSKVKKQQKTDHFKNISIDLARRYAEVFGIEIGQFFQFSSGISAPVNPVKTKNPFITVFEYQREGA
jgi:hypothetical protein